MNLVKGDKVVVIAGKDKGKQGTIQKVIPEKKNSNDVAFCWIMMQ